MIDKSWLDHILTCRMEHCQDANKLADALRDILSYTSAGGVPNYVDKWEALTEVHKIASEALGE